MGIEKTTGWAPYITYNHILLYLYIADVYSGVHNLKNKSVIASLCEILIFQSL